MIMRSIYVLAEEMGLPGLRSGYFASPRQRFDQQPVCSEHKPARAEHLERRRLPGHPRLDVMEAVLRELYIGVVGYIGGASSLGQRRRNWAS